MPYYRVVLHGGNIRIESENKSALRLTLSARTDPIEGFYTTRIVQASNEDRAIAAAIASAEEELTELDIDKVNIGRRPDLSCENVARIGLWSYLFARPRRGFTFY